MAAIQIAEEHREVARLLKAADGNAVALTGAGVSTASGIPDFRSAGGLWSTVNPAEVASTEALADDPARFWRFYDERFAGLDGVAPCAAHEHLAAMEGEAWLTGVITQNVDGLHQAAGSRNVAEMHGRLDALRCQTCDTPYTWEQTSDLRDANHVPRCPLCPAGSGVIRPGIVLFGEGLPQEAMQAAERWTVGTQIMLAIGSSLVVSPVSQLPAYALSVGAALVIINDSPTPYDDHAIVLRGDLSEQLGAIRAAIDDPSR